MKRYEFQLPWPPSVNHYWRHVNNRTLISKEGRHYRNKVHGVVLAESNRSLLLGRLSVTAVAFPPDRRRRDLDNVLKATLDSLEYAGVYQDDAQIDKLAIERGPITKLGRMDVVIEEM